MTLPPRSGILTEFAPMRWLMIVLLASLGALLLAAACVACHIWFQRGKLQRENLSAIQAAPETDSEP